MEIAEKNWLNSFMNCRKDLSLRIPRATSIQRISNFNPHNINLFLDNLQEVMKRQL